MDKVAHTEASAREPAEESEKRRVPQAPRSLEETGISREFLLELTLRIARSTTQFTTEWLTERICLPNRLVHDLVESHRAENTLAVVGQSGNFGLVLEITQRGRESSNESMKTTGYAGPAPVPLNAYVESIEQQVARLPKVASKRVVEAVRELVLPDESVQIAGLASFSARSLFLHGPPGNGKTTLGELLHRAFEGELWIPHCIGIGNSVIRIFDPECHESTGTPGNGTPRSASEKKRTHDIDRRWTPIRRPFIVAGGELTIEALDLSYHDGLGYYEAPLHLKANAGTFLIDDFGHQRVDHQELLNRWIHPLESGVDFMTLKTGQKFPVPFRPMLIISTNLDPDKVMDPAFLRRMGYKIHMGNPTAEQFEEIFRRYAKLEEITVPQGLISSLLGRYAAENRPLRGCEARDLIERAKDICNYREHPVQLTEDIMSLAWRGYFGGGASLSMPKERRDTAGF